jgi:hypothetical protein
MASMSILHLIALGLVVVLGRLVFAYYCPFRECRWCRPGGVAGGSVPGRLAGHQPKQRQRKRRCWRCKGTKLTRRWGAWHAHKVRDSLIRAREEQQ